MASGEDQEAGVYLTRADMPELVKSVAEALMVQLRKVTPAPEEAGSSHSTGSKNALAIYIYSYQRAGSHGWNAKSQERTAPDPETSGQFATSTRDSREPLPPYALHEGFPKIFD